MRDKTLIYATFVFWGFLDTITTTIGVTLHSPAWEGNSLMRDLIEYHIGAFVGVKIVSALFVCVALWWLLQTEDVTHRRVYRGFLHVPVAIGILVTLTNTIGILVA